MVFANGFFAKGFEEICSYEQIYGWKHIFFTTDHIRQMPDKLPHGKEINSFVKMMDIKMININYMFLTTNEP